MDTCISMASTTTRLKGKHAMNALPRASLDRLLSEVRACQFCADYLPLGPRPVVRASVDARVLIVGQAPGARVHATGIPWHDASGKRLRQWLGVDDAAFYDEAQFAIIPIGFCYPGRGRSGDRPPRPECAPLWLDKLLAQMPKIELTLLAGQYAQRHFLGARCKSSLAETVAAWREYAPAFIALPHPSPRNVAWFGRHPWFDSEILPMLRARIGKLLGVAGL
jgi:uracil-DNA glycosylase